MPAPHENSPNNDLRQQLQALLTGRVCLMGLGNIDFGDDGFGVRLAQELLDAGVPDVIVAGTTPENYIGKVADASFDRLLFLDVVDFDAAPGSVVLLDAKQISARFPQISTHKISLGVLAQVVQANRRTEIWLLGVQPESLVPTESDPSVEMRLAASPAAYEQRCGGQLSPTVTASLNALCALLLELAHGKPHVAADAPVRPAERSSADCSPKPKDEASTP